MFTNATMFKKHDCYHDNYYYHITLHFNTTSDDLTDSSEQWPILETLQSNKSIMLKPLMKYVYKYSLTMIVEKEHVFLSMEFLLTNLTDVFNVTIICLWIGLYLS